MGRGQDEHSATTLKSHCACVCLSVRPVTQPPCFPTSPLPVAQSYLLCLFVCLTWNQFHYLSACLSPSLPSIQVSTCVPNCLSTSQQRGWGRRRGGCLVKGSQGTHRSACLWSLHYRIWHSARAHLISLRTHTYTHIRSHVNTRTDRPDRPGSAAHMHSSWEAHSSLINVPQTLFLWFYTWPWMQMKQRCLWFFFVSLKLLLELHHCDEHLLVGLQPGWRMTEFEVEHQWKGTDGSLISKLETKMINTSEHSGFPWDGKLVCPPHTCVCVCVFVSAQVWVSLSIKGTSTLSEKCMFQCWLRLLLYLQVEQSGRRSSNISPHMWPYKVLWLQDEWQRERGGGAEQPSTRKSLKHTTDIKGSENHSEIERRKWRKTWIKGERERENGAVGASECWMGTDMQKVAKLNVSPTQDNIVIIWHDGLCNPNGYEKSYCCAAAWGLKRQRAAAVSLISFLCKSGVEDIRIIQKTHI